MDNMSIRQFTDALASSAPVPGGGGASALCGALAAALGSMVCNLTVGKKKYADVEEEVKETLQSTEALRTELLALIREDAEAFEPLSRAYSLPRETEEEIRLRDTVMEEALRRAGETPLRMMRAAAKLVPPLRFLSEKGSRLVVSDVGVAAYFARAALEGAALNVYINTRLMKDRSFAEAMEREADELGALARDLNTIARSVLSELRA